MQPGSSDVAYHSLLRESGNIRDLVLFRFKGTRNCIMVSMEKLISMQHQGWEMSVQEVVKGHKQTVSSAPLAL